ncbi:MAG: hypothetical protein V2B18_02840 [Pseudomonadota bacterium]
MKSLVSLLVKIFLGLVAFAVAIWFCMLNKNIFFEMRYFGFNPRLPFPYYWEADINVQFWQVMLLFFSVGALVVALVEFASHLQWIGERRKILRDKKDIFKMQTKIKRLESDNAELMSENQALKAHMDEQNAAFDLQNKELKNKTKELEEKSKPQPDKPADADAKPKGAVELKKTDAPPAAAPSAATQAKPDPSAKEEPKTAKP